MTVYAHSESIRLEADSLSQIINFTQLDMAEVIANGEVGTLLADVNLEVKNYYQDKKTMNKLFPVKDDIEIFRSTARTRKVNAQYQKWNDTAEQTWNYFQTSKDSVLRKKNIAPWRIGIAQTWYNKMLEERKRGKVGPAGYGTEIIVAVMKELMDDRMLIEARYCVDALYSAASKPAIFNGIGDGVSSDLNAYNYAAIGAIWSPSGGKGSTNFNPLIHMNAPVAGTENDVAVSTNTLLYMIREIALDATKAGGTFYTTRDGLRVFMRLRETHPELFSKDYDAPFAGGIANVIAPVLSFYNGAFNVAVVDDLNPGNRVYGTGEADTGYLVDSTVDTRNVFGFYVKGTPIVQHKWADEMKAGTLGTNDILEKVFAFDYVDEKDNDRGNIIVVESAYRLVNEDRLRGALTY